MKHLWKRVLAVMLAGTMVFSIAGCGGGSGNGGIDPAGIACQATGDAPQTVQITQSEDGIRVEIVTE